ncbi:right-handed parallel beta-helix repeat-containing protein [Halorientalis halophila]|uniref:right-handed parallel beta-helix repeat-containing protein n=1 Tax=Halorientalis halophila TaxID=3108499 RepID=UPI003008161D
MARRQEESESRKERLIERRSLLKAVGGTAAAVGATSFLGSAGAQETGGSAVDFTDTTVDLGKQGLSNGDLIDPYLDEHLSSGTEVRIPAGEYEFEGEGLGGSYENAALVGSTDGVVFNRPAPEELVRPDVTAESGTVRLENITLKGKKGQEQSRWRVGANEGARMELVNVNMPDGTVDGSDSTGIYAGDDHAGTLWVRNCYFSMFGNVACYVSDPYKGGNGAVIVENCDFVNTGMSAVRLGPDGSVVRDCYFEATEKAPGGNTGWNQRGIKIGDPGSDITIENCDFNWSDTGAMAVKFDEDGQDGGGVLRNLRVANDGGTTFSVEWDIEGNWSGENIHLTGDADHYAPDHFETVTGSNAESPNTDYSIWKPIGENVEPSGPGAGAGSGSDDGGSDSEDGSDAEQEPLEHSIVLQASEDNPDTNCNARFTTTGPIQFADEAEPNTDEITENEDGTFTATSVEMNPAAVDSYTFDGEITSYEVTSGYEVAVELDGEATTFAEIVGEDGSSGDSDAGSDSDSGSDGGDDQQHKVLVIDGTGDAQSVAKYQFSVTGTAEYDAGRSDTSEGLPWDKMTDHVDDGRVVGVVGNGKDAFRFTGSLDSISVDGNAGVKILEV